MKRSIPLIAALFFSGAVLAQTSNPEPGDVWSYFGPTLGSGWATAPMAVDGSNALQPFARVNLFPSPINGNCLVGDGSDWVSDTCPGGSGGMDTSASNAVLPATLANLGLQIPASCDGVTGVAGAITTGTAAFFAAAASFVSGDVGKPISIAGAGSTQSARIAAVQSAGSGYALLDTITLTDGTVLQVMTLSGTGVATAIVITPVSEASPPSNPVSQSSTSGAGTGATFNLTFARDNLVTTIQSVTNSTNVVLATNAAATVASAKWGYGTDYSSEIIAALATGVQLPRGKCGIASTITYGGGNSLLGVGYGSSPLTTILWLGSQNSDVVSSGTPTGRISGIKLGDFNVDGNCAAKGGLVARGITASYLNPIYVNYTTHFGIDIGPSSGPAGFEVNKVDRWTADMSAACSSTATAVRINRASITQNVHNNRFPQLRVVYQNGDGLDLGNSDSNTFDKFLGQVTGGGSGKSVRFRAGAADLTQARSNVFTNSGFGANGITAEGGTFPSKNNKAEINTESYALNVTLDTGATFSYTTSTGNSFSNAATTMQQSGTLKSGITIDSESLQTLYRPTNISLRKASLFFDLQDSAGVEKTYAGIGGKIDANTAGAHTGRLAFFTANAGTTTENMGLFPTGGLVVGSIATSKTPCTGCVLINNGAYFETTDSAGTVRGLLRSTSGNITELIGSAAGLKLLDGAAATTQIAASDGSGNISFSHDLKVDSIKAVTPAGAGHTINNDGTNTDVNAPSGNLDLKVANASVLRVTSAGASMQVGTITVPTPSGSTDAANKAYADSIAAGVVTHASAAAATTANLTATYANGASGVGATLTNAGAQAAFAVDGYSASLNDRILVKNQTAAFENGIYTVTTVGTGATNWVLTRATDFDAAAANEVAAGASVIVVSGTAGAKTQWLETGQGPFTIGTTAIVFDQVLGGSASGTVNSGTANQLGYYAGAGTTISGLTTANNGALVTSAGGVPSISSTLPNAVQDNITRLGSIGVGVWNGTAIAQEFGGTGSDLSLTGGASQVLKQSTVGGNVTVGQLAYSDITGTLPNPAVGTKGGVEAVNAVASNWIRSINTSGVPQLSRPTCGDLSDAATGCTTTVGTAATANTGTSGATLPFLNGTNTWSGTQTFGAVMTTVNAQTGTTYTLLASDCGKTVLITNAAAITVTAPNNLAVGCHIAIVQGGAGQITVSPQGGGTLVSAHSYTKTFGPRAGIGLSVLTNAGGSAAEWYLFGDGA